MIDLPRVWEPWTDQVLLGSNRVYVVTDMTVPGLRLARRMAGALVQRLPDIKPRVIVNRFEQQLLFGTGLRRTDVERALDGYLEGTVSNNSSSCARRSTAGSRSMASRPAAMSRRI